jgi:alginate O-acetyltransferase complex protein AlgI
MLIASFQFAVFTLAVLAVYHKLPEKYQNVFLLIVSGAMIALFSLEFALVFAVLTFANYWLSQRAERGMERAGLALWAGIAINITALVYFKYADFYIPYFVYYLKRAGITLEATTLIFVLPVGLSFFIVQAIAYLLDINRGVATPTKNWVSFALFMVYFPKLVSGPIERSRTLLAQLEKPRQTRKTVVGKGVVLILTGLVRKLVIADLLSSLIPDDLFSSPGSYNAAHLGLWLLVYAIVIYNDFAGYTAIVRGVSVWFGIELSANFNTPYFARNFSEFWQRWHITLSDWLRDYIFMPLTRRFLRMRLPRNHPVTAFLPPLATMGVSALWHSAAPGMLVWGLLHGLYQIIERSLSLLRPGRPLDRQPIWLQSVSRLVVFILVVLAWVPFRMDLTTALVYWRTLFNLADWGDLPALGALPGMAFWIILVVLLVNLILDILEARKGKMVYLKLPVLVRAILINCAVYAILAAYFLKLEAAPPFIYQGF